MKIKLKIFLFLALLMSISFLCNAQMVITLKMNRSNYLQYERIYAKVDIRNNSGHAIVFGDNKKLHGKLLFKIIDSQNISVEAIPNVSYPMAGVIIPAGEHKEFIVQVSDFYNLKRCGTYRMYAYVEHNMFEDAYRSRETSFEVSKGFVMWERVVGVPDFMQPGKKGKVRNRTYKQVRLLQGSEKGNYLVVEDKKRVYNVLFLGNSLGEEKISHEVDNFSNLHIMVPISPKIFVHITIDVNGKVDEESVYKRTRTVPTMVRNPETGKVYVTGGAPAKQKRDYK
jgi:hypothetical protein